MMFISGQECWKVISRNLPTKTRSKKNKYRQAVEPDPLPRRLFRVKTSHGLKREAGDLWSNTRSHH